MEKICARKIKGKFFSKLVLSFIKIRKLSPLLLKK